jgi:hypothetical protein
MSIPPTFTSYRRPQNQKSSLSPRFGMRSPSKPTTPDPTDLFEFIQFPNEPLPATIANHPSEHPKSGFTAWEVCTLSKVKPHQGSIPGALHFFWMRKNRQIIAVTYLGDTPKGDPLYGPKELATHEANHSPLLFQLSEEECEEMKQEMLAPFDRLRRSFYDDKQASQPGTPLPDERLHNPFSAQPVASSPIEPDQYWRISPLPEASLFLEQVGLFPENTKDDKASNDRKKRKKFCMRSERREVEASPSLERFSRHEEYKDVHAEESTDNAIDSDNPQVRKNARNKLTKRRWRNKLKHLKKEKELAEATLKDRADQEGINEQPPPPLKKDESIDSFKQKEEVNRVRWNRLWAFK